MKNPLPLFLIYPMRWQLFWAVTSCFVATAHWSGVYYQYDSIKWWLLDIFLAAYTFIKVANCKQIAVTKFGMVVLFFIAWSLISSMWASHHYASLELGARYLLIASSIYFLSRDLNRESARELLLNTAIFSCLSFFLVLTTERYILKHPFQNANYTPLGFINHAGHVYIFWIPILFWGTFQAKKYVSILCTLLLLATLTLLADSAIRASIVGLGVACVVTAGLFWKSNRQFSIKALGLLGLLSIALLTVSISQPNDTMINTKLTRVANAPDLNYASSDRIIMYKNTFKMIIDNPFGVGLNNFEYIHPLYGQAGTANASPFMNETEILKQPHNFYLKSVSETGWLGGALLLGVLLGLLAPAFSAKKSIDQWSGVYLLVLCATFTNGLFCAVFSNPASLWFCLILTACYIATYKQSSWFSGVNITTPSRSLAFGFIAIFLGYSCSNLTSQILANDGFKTQNSLKLARAVDIYPGNERAWFDLATTHFEQDGNPAEAISAMQHFLSLYPYHIGARYKITQWYCFQRDFSHCKTEALRLLSYYPSFKPTQQLYLQANEALRRTQ
ncbi:MAG: O-antigen ligase family protein [Marinagarivorans sp.]